MVYVSLPGINRQFGQQPQMLLLAFREPLPALVLAITNQHIERETRMGFGYREIN